MKQVAERLLDALVCPGEFHFDPDIAARHIEFTRLGITMHERITEVEEVYENGIFTFTPTFGSPLPETLDLGDDTE